MNQTDTLGVVNKMRAYVVLAENEIEKRKIQCKITGGRGSSHPATKG